MECGGLPPLLPVGRDPATATHHDWLTAAILVVRDRVIDPASKPRPGRGGWRGAWDALGKLCREQGWITLGLAPLSLWLFHQVSLVGLVVNLFAIPWVILVVTPLAFLGMLWSPLWLLCSGCLQVLMVCLTEMQTWPYAVWITAAPPAWLALLAMGGVWVFMAFPQRSWRWLGWTPLLPMLFWQAPKLAWGSVQLLFADAATGAARRSISRLASMAVRWATSVTDRSWARASWISR